MALATALARRELGLLEHGMDRLWAVGHMPIGFRFGPGLLPGVVAFQQRVAEHIPVATGGVGPQQPLVDLVRRPVVTSDASGQPAIAGPVIRALLAADWAGAMTARLASIPAARAWTSRPRRGRR